MQEIARVVKSNGIVIITTPNNENLALNENFCPECGCTFHKWQHVNSFTAKKMEYLMQDYGFKLEASIATHFAFEKTLFKKMYLTFRNFVKKSSNRPHLMYVGRKI